MHLIVDSGNSLTKLSLFEGEQLKDTFYYKNIFDLKVQAFFSSFPNIQDCIICSVNESEKMIADFISPFVTPLIFDFNTPIPIQNHYKTKETLGKDRIAAAVGAKYHFKENPVLIIDAGTCITYDVVNKENEFKGGSISPGIEMRYKALHTFTQKLPLILPKEDYFLPGSSTEESIDSGVLASALFEMQGFINYYQSQYEGLITVLCGGDMKYFDKKLKNSIFAFPNLVAEGLQKILHFNAKNQ